MPLSWIVGRWLRDDLGPNPIAEVMNGLGLATLILLLATLACTPLKIVLGWNWPLAMRRSLGLYAFFYACLHLGVYVGLDQFFDFSEIGKDIVKRKFITVGFAAAVLMVPLALTSTNKMVKRLGFRRWKRLHRLTYVVGILGIVHFVWREKVVGVEQTAYAAALLLLLVIRLVPRRAAHAHSPPSSQSG